MSKLWLQVLAAAVLAGLLLWGERGGGALAGSVRHLAGTYIRQQVELPAGVARLATPSRPGQSVRVAAPRFSWPLVGTVRAHAGGGIEILAPGGALVRAAASGQVTAVAPYPPGVSVTVQGGGVVLRYLHLGPSDVRRGEQVRVGEVIGAVSHFSPGETPHLTLEALRGRKPLALPGLLGRP